MTFDVVLVAIAVVAMFATVAVVFGRGERHTRRS
jgi:hypothetical protein